SDLTKGDARGRPVHDPGGARRPELPRGYPSRPAGRPAPRQEPRVLRGGPPHEGELDAGPRAPGATRGSRAAEAAPPGRGPAAGWRARTPAAPQRGPDGADHGH